MKTRLESPAYSCLCASARACLFVLLIGALASAAKGQTILAWNLKPGETLAVDMSQHTESRVGFSSKSAVTKIDLLLRMSWHVQESNSEAIQVKQTIQQVRANLSGTGGTAEFDSANQTRVTGPAKQLADSMRPLVGAEFEVIFSPRGEVKSAKPLNDAAQSLLAAGEKPGDPAASPTTSLAQLVSQSIVPLPDKPAAINDQWTASRSLQSQPVPLKHETTYALTELLDEGGTPIARISTTGRLLEEPAQGQKPLSPLRIKSHEQTGSILFSVDSGRPTLIEQTQKLHTERTYRDTTIDVTLNSTLKMSFAKPSATN